MREYILIGLGAWCVLWWIWAICDLAVRKPWIDKELQDASRQFPEWLSLAIFAFIGIVFIFMAPINKPCWWLEKEISKRNMRRAAKEINDVLKDPEIKEKLDTIMEASFKQKDQGW